VTPLANQHPNDNTTTPGSFYLIDDMDLMEYEKSTQPYVPNPEQFEWLTMHNFSNIGVITLLLVKK
jgi:hypothetical protein